MARPIGPSIDLTGARHIVKALERELSRSGSAVQKAGSRALRKTLRSGKSEASKNIRAVINLKKKPIDERISTKVVSHRQLIGRLTVRDRRIELVEFLSRAQIVSNNNRQRAGMAKGVSVKVFKKQPAKVYPGTFLNIGKKDRQWHVLKRDGADRYPVFIQYGPSIAKEFNDVLPAFTERAATVLQKNLEHELAFALSKL